MTQIIENALVIGATGLVGRSVLKQLNQLENCRKITAIVRRIDGVCDLTELEKVEYKVCENFTKLNASELAGYSHVWSCLGTTRKQAGSKDNFYHIDFEMNAHIARLLCNDPCHYILLSAMGANTQSPFFYSRVKGQLEQYIQQLPLEKISIVQPSLLLGQRSEARFLEDFSQKVARCLNQVIANDWLYKPVSAMQVAYTMVEIAQTQTKKIEIYDNLSIQKISRGNKK